MHEFLFANNAGWFTIPAIIGTVFFTLRLLLMLIGGHDGGLGGGGDLHFDLDHGGDVNHGDSSDAFKLLSIQSIAAFMMGFGWGGVGGLRGADWSMTTSAIFAVAAGAGMVWLLGLLLKSLIDLQSSGNITLASAIGAEGDVYATVPAHGQGRGQVKLVIRDRQRIFNAISENEVLTSNTRIRVTRVNEDNTLTVTHA